MLVYLLIPVALAIVFFTMSFFQKETTVVNTSETTKEKTSKKPTKKPSSATKKPVQKKEDVEEKEKTIQQKNFTEEIDIHQLASIQGRTSTKNPVLVKKSEKKDEKKDEKKEEKKEEVVAADDKKKKKKTDWVTKEVKPQRKKEEKKEEETTSEEKKDEKKDDKKRSDKKGDRKERGDRKRGDKKGDKKGDKEEEGEKKEKSIYKAFKPHGAEADKVVEPKTDDKKEEVKEDKKEEAESTDDSKKPKKEKKPKVEDTKSLKPRVRMNYNPYKSSEDFWDTNLADSYVAPVEITKVSVPLGEETEKTEKPKTEKKGGRKEKSSEKGSGSASVVTEPKPDVQIKVGRGGITGRTDPWAKTDSQSASQVEGAENFPSLAQQNNQQAINANKQKKIKKNSTTINNKVEASTSGDEASSTQKKTDSHKREADTLFEYEVEAPSDKKIKLGDEAEQKQSEKQETFVLPTTSE